MSRSPRLTFRDLLFLCAGGLVALIVWSLVRPPDSREPSAAAGESDGSALVHGLLGENLDERRFSFATVAEASSGHKVLPLDLSNPTHRRVSAAIDEVLGKATSDLSSPDSPVRELRRINEGSRFFEEALRKGLDAVDGLRCEVPTNREGEHQRSGYPDLKLIDESSGEIFYLDPKLVEEGSWNSSFRSFYFEPKNKTIKINDDAVHLLVGIGHDGRDGEWTFGEWKVTDLSTLEVRLKAEFQASNRELYDSRAE